MSSIGQSGSQNSHSVLAVDVTALWNQKTTGIQRVIRETTPHLAAAAAERGWDIVLVKQHVRGLEEIVRWSGDFDASRVKRDLDLIAAASLTEKQAGASLVTRLQRKAAQSFRQADLGGRLGLRFLERRLRRLIPDSVRREFHGWWGKHRRLRVSADAYLSFSAGLLPVCPPEFAPPERAVFVIHDLIPLHYSDHYPLEFTQAFARNISDLAFGPYGSQGKFVTASRHVAADIDELFHSLSRKRVSIDLVEWGFDRETFFPDPDPQYRRRLGIPEDTLLVAAVSTQDPRKRFAGIQQAVSKLNAHAVFLGRGQPRREGNAIYLGHVADVDVRKAYSSADVVVNWSAAEGFGLPTIEALACGAKVVVPPDNPTSIEVGGESVFVAEGADVDSLVNAIRNAFFSEAPVPDLTRFNWANSAEVLESLLWPAPKGRPAKRANRPLAIATLD
jgi:glycosyltransferase involved in cell wall biosynthesis